MKKHILLIALLLTSLLTHAQVKIGDNPTTINPSSLLELESTNKALLITRVPSVASVTNPVNGMIVYDIAMKCTRAFQDGIWSECLGVDNGIDRGTCLTLPAIDGAENATISGWVAGWGGSVPKLISPTLLRFDADNDYKVQNFEGGASPQGGNFTWAYGGGVPVNNTTGRGGPQTTVTGLTVGNIYSFAIYWQRISYWTPSGIGYTTNGLGNLVAQIDGYEQYGEKASTSLVDSWQKDVFTFTARSTSAVIKIGGQYVTPGTGTIKGSFLAIDAGGSNNCN